MAVCTAFALWLQTSRTNTSSSRGALPAAALMWLPCWSGAAMVPTSTYPLLTWRRNLRAFTLRRWRDRSTAQRCGLHLASGGRGRQQDKEKEALSRGPAQTLARKKEDHNVYKHYNAAGRQWCQSSIDAVHKGVIGAPSGSLMRGAFVTPAAQPLFLMPSEWD